MEAKFVSVGPVKTPQFTYYNFWFSTFKHEVSIVHLCELTSGRI